MAEIHHDVCVNVRDLRVANAKALESALIDETPSPHPSDFLEHGAGARIPIQPRMLAAGPTQRLPQPSSARCLRDLAPPAAGAAHGGASGTEHGGVRANSNAFGA